MEEEQTGPDRGTPLFQTGKRAPHRLEGGRRRQDQGREGPQSTPLCTRAFVSSFYSRPQNHHQPRSVLPHAQLVYSVLLYFSGR